MNDQEVKNEPEMVSADDRKLREMCLSLKRIDAPKDFDFKLKARIAKTNPGKFQPRFGWAFRYALPVLAIVMLATVLAYNSGFWSSPENKSVAATSPVDELKNSASLPDNNLVAVQISPSSSDSNSDNANVPAPKSPKLPENEIAQSNLAQVKHEKKSVESKDNSSGSRDFSSTNGTVEQPKFNSNLSPRIPESFIKTNPTSIQSILSDIGIKAALENGKWTVKSVTPNGMTERSGVKKDDVIEAIDDQPISSETKFDKTFSGKTITVSREGKKLEIKLQN
jgi:hypothetical protein